jgi:RNA polymerase-binding protein DksA
MKRQRQTDERGQRLPVKVKAASTTAAVLNSVNERNEPVTKWDWHYRALLSARDRLLRERGERLRAAVESLEVYSMDMADTATDEFDHALELSQLSAEQDLLYEVEEAIQRIMNNTYGFCEETGKPIPAARLKAIPWARFAHDVELRLENQGDIRKPHLGALGLARAGSIRPWEAGESNEEKDLPRPEDQALRKVFKPVALPTVKSAVPPPLTRHTQRSRANL